MKNWSFAQVSDSLTSHKRAMARAGKNQDKGDVAHLAALEAEYKVKKSAKDAADKAQAEKDANKA